MHDEYSDMEALVAVYYGKVLTPKQEVCRGLYDSHRRHAVKALKRSRELKTLASLRDVVDAEKIYNEWKDLVCEVFIKCLLEHDRNGIIELADAAAFFKGKIGASYTPDDSVRYQLLRIKQQGLKLTMREIAKRAYSKEEFTIYEPSDFRSLRRICRQLEVPVKPPPAGRTNKAKNRS